jgi:hypothetical protein
LAKLKLVTADTEDEFESIAIAIGGFGITQNENQRHIGILFQTELDGLRIIHLGFHNRFACEVPEGPFYWFPVGQMDRTVLLNFADWLDIFWNIHGPNLPYSISPFNSNPLEGGNLRLLKHGEGFTCATFVLWAFDLFDYPLLSLEGWPEREDDKLWRTRILRMLEDPRWNAAPEHISAQASAIESAIRFRPEEVGSAVRAYAGAILEYQQADLLARGLLQEMNADGAIAAPADGECCLLTI